MQLSFPCGTDKGAPPALLTFRNGCDEEEDLEWRFPSFPSLNWLDRTDILSGDAAELWLLGLSVLGDTLWPSQADPEMSRTSMAWAGSLGPRMLLLIEFAANYTQGL